MCLLNAIINHIVLLQAVMSDVSRTAHDASDLNWEDGVGTSHMEMNRTYYYSPSHDEHSLTLKEEVVTMDTGEGSKRKMCAGGRDGGPNERSQKDWGVVRRERSEEKQKRDRLVFFSPASPVGRIQECLA